MGHTAHIPPINGDFDDLIGQLERLREEIRSKAKFSGQLLLELPPERQASAVNLLHYLALRSHDLRPLQERLAHLALSSIGRSEPNVMATLDSVLQNLYVLSGRQPSSIESTAVYHEFDELENRLELNTNRLMGDPPDQRRAYIMVTVPAAAATDYMMVHQLVKNGMDCMRINCAHDSKEIWLQMIGQMRYAERVMKKSCRILMDLRGPKLRTGPMTPEPAVLKIRPTRNEYGRLLRPARIWMTADPVPDSASCAADAVIRVEASWLNECQAGNKILLKDMRGSKRRWIVREVSDGGCWVEAAKTAYLTNGTVLRLRGFEKQMTLAGLPQREGQILVRAGDVLRMTATEKPGTPSLHDADGALMKPGKISLPIPEVFRDARPGESVSFDDCRIVGIIEKCREKKLRIRITHTRKPVEKLQPDKGINLPDTILNLPALSEEDIEDLPFVAGHADMIGLSFTNTADDVRELRERLLELGHEDVGVVVKIETKRGFANLPEILIEALKFPACGVMIARGDLAAECGFERMAELQEEILWVCESAHVPVIWATQVLEGLTKRGHASRAEITDAAMGQAAECVMLNKGPYINEAVRMLDDILRRMQDHKSKKRSMLRKLHLASEFRQD